MLGIFKSKERKEREAEEKAKAEQLEIIKQKQKNILVDYITKGTIPINMENSSDIILKKDETINLVLNDVNFSEPRAVRYTEGKYGGGSVRVAKGVTIRSGRGNSKSESVDEIRMIDTGTLVITNKRIVFSGNIKSINIDLNKLINLTPYSDGIATRRSNKQKTEYFTNTNNTNLKLKIKNDKYDLTVDGIVLQAIITNNLNNL
jgi:hypothetical protein